MQTASADRVRLVALEAKLAKKDAIIAEVSEEYLALKKAWGELKQRWVPPHLRDTVVDFVRTFSARTELSALWVLTHLSVVSTQFYRWTVRHGRVKHAQRPHPVRPLAHVRGTTGDSALSRHACAGRLPSDDLHDARRRRGGGESRHRVSGAPRRGVLDRWNQKASRQGTGFVQPLQPHEHWHIDISYVNIAGTFYYLCSILDGATRFLVNWERRDRMTTADAETVLQGARERYPAAAPRIISDNGPQFIAKDFKVFIRLAGMTQVRTSPCYPQSNRKLERWHQTLKVTTIRSKAPDSVEAARRMVASFVAYYNHHRLHSAIGFITPADVLAGRADTIWAARDQKT